MQNCNSKCKSFVVISLALFFFISTNVSYASTDVAGDIAADTFWTTAGSPFIIHGSVAVLSGITLTVEPGVVIKFAQDELSYLDIFGTLLADGIEANPVYFTSLYDDSRGGDTNGDGGATLPSLFDEGQILFFGTSSAPSVLRYADIAYSDGLFLDGAEVKLDHTEIHDVEYGIFGLNSTLSLSTTIIRDALTYGILITESELVVSGSLISPLPETFSAVAITGNSNLTIENSRLEDAGFGVALRVDSGSSAVVTNSVFQNGLRDAAWVHGNSALAMDDVTVDGFPRSGISIYDGSLLFTNGAITNNGSGVMFNDGPVTVSHSSITGNADYGVLRESGVTVADARNNWWGSDAGPGSSVSEGVLFDPWLTSPPEELPPAECCSSVAFIPGLQATRLALGDNRLWEPNRNADVEKLFLDDLGNPRTAGIKTDGILDEAAGFNIYKNFMVFLDELVGDETIEQWQAFPYDWRFSAADVVASDIPLPDGSTYRMKERIEELAASSETGKVTIITHSNGGLVAKHFIRALEADGKAGLLDKLILVASPQTGTPKALAGMLHGDDQTIPSKLGFVLNKKTARTFAENMPSAYGLLPSETYFADVFDPVIEFDEDVSAIYDFGALYGDSIDSRNELEAFLLGDDGVRTEPDDDDTDSPNVLDADMLATASSSQALTDAWTAPAGIRVIQIAGWGLDTIRGVRYKDCDVPFCPDTLSNLDRELLLVHDGDGTVVIPSAVAMDCVSPEHCAEADVETYYVNLKEYNKELLLNRRRNREHADILEVEYLKDFIENIIVADGLALPNFIASDKPISKDEDKILRFRVHSPVSLDLFDGDGNHTGLVQNPDPDSDLAGIEQEIPNSYYWEFGE
ncbi:MAG: Acetyltransferases and hydrolases with the alpha/beta hydrolase fold protein, partial [Parcubacteria group bacterium Gr01-1014_70]